MFHSRCPICIGSGVPNCGRISYCEPICFNRHISWLSKAILAQLAELVGNHRNSTRRIRWLEKCGYLKSLRPDSCGAFIIFVKNTVHARGDKWNDACVVGSYVKINSYNKNHGFYYTDDDEDCFIVFCAHVFLLHYEWKWNRKIWSLFWKIDVSFSKS